MLRLEVGCNPRPDPQAKGIPQRALGGFQSSHNILRFGWRRRGESWGSLQRFGRHLGRCSGTAEGPQKDGRQDETETLPSELAACPNGARRKRCVPRGHIQTVPPHTSVLSQPATLGCFSLSSWRQLGGGNEVDEIIKTTENQHQEAEPVSGDGCRPNVPLVSSRKAVSRLTSDSPIESS